MTTKRSLAAAALLAAAFALAGCGARPYPQAKVRAGGASTTVAPVAPTPKARLLASMQRATESKTARIALHWRFGGADEEGLTFDGAGVADLSGQKIDLQLHAPAGAFTTTASEIRIVGRTAYIYQRGLWTSLALDGNWATLGLPDPTSYVAFLQGVADAVRVDGHETLRGVDTTRYTATVDIARALARTSASPSARAAVNNADSLFGDLDIPVTVWIDALGRLRKLTLSMDLSGDASTFGISPTAKIAATVEFYDFGVPVAVQIPQGAVSAQIRSADNVAQSDLRNALTAEKVQYADTQEYTADTLVLKHIEPSLEWGTKLTVAVTGGTVGTGSVVCLAERSASGTTFALADVASGAHVGTYYGKSGCPSPLDENTGSTLSHSW